MQDEYEKIERLYNIKLAKYAIEDIDIDLAEMLFDEAVKEVMASAKFNGGKKVRG